MKENYFRVLLLFTLFSLFFFPAARYLFICMFHKQNLYSPKKKKKARSSASQLIFLCLLHWTCFSLLDIYIQHLCRNHLISWKLAFLIFSWNCFSLSRGNEDIIICMKMLLNKSKTKHVFHLNSLKQYLVLVCIEVRLIKMSLMRWSDAMKMYFFSPSFQLEIKYTNESPQIE